MEQTTFLKINPADSVVVCLQAKKQGDVIDVDGRQIIVNQDTPAGHKVLILTSSNTVIPSATPRRI